MVVKRRSLAMSRPYSPTLRRAVRVTGVVAMAFVVTHLPELRFASLGTRLGGAELASLLDRDLSSTWLDLPWRGLWYLVGTGSVVFHFVAGLAGSLSDWRGSSARSWSGWALAIAGAALWLLAADVIVLHATGLALVGGHAQYRVSVAPCPMPAKSP